MAVGCPKRQIRIYNIYRLKTVSYVVFKNDFKKISDLVFLDRFLGYGCNREK